MERPNPSVVCKDCNYVGYLSYENIITIMKTMMLIFVVHYVER